MTEQDSLDRHLTIEALRASEAAAIAAAELVGKGDERQADQVAAEAMRKTLNRAAVDGTVVIGEGERDDAPMLFIGEKVGSGGGPNVDIAVDPLEGATIAATGGANAMSVVAFSEPGGLLHAPDVYMEKLAVGGGLPVGLTDLGEAPADVIRSLAGARGVDTSDIVACILNRPRHEEIIAEVREAGARVRLIPDGDVAGVIATSTPASGIDIYLGIGGAPQGVLAAAALRCVGGQMQARLVFRGDDERSRAHALGIDDLNRRYELDDLARGDVIFAATGVTDGNMLDGVRREGSLATTHSLVMRSRTGTMRWVRSRRDLTKSPFIDDV